MLGHIDTLDAQIERLNREIEKRMRPFQKELEILDTIPGVARRGAEEVIAEIGVDMSPFPSAAHLASWSGMCPGNHESAGKHTGGKTRKGNPWLRATLVEAAHAAARTRGTYLNAQFHRIAACRGRKRAAVAVGHTILIAIYHMLEEKKNWNDLGFDYLDRRNKEAVARRMAKRLEALGYHVTIKEAA